MTTPIRNWQKIFRLEFLYSEENKQCQCCNSWLEIWRRYWFSKKMVPGKGFNLLMVLFTTVPCSTVSQSLIISLYLLETFTVPETGKWCVRPQTQSSKVASLNHLSQECAGWRGCVWSYLVVTWCIVFEWCNRERWGHACDWTLQEILLNSLYYTLSSTRSQFLEFVNIDWTHLEPFLAII